MPNEPERHDQEPARLTSAVRLVLAILALPLIIVGLMLIFAVVRDVSTAPTAVLIIAIGQIAAGGGMAVAAARGRSGFFGSESVSSILLPVVGALALVLAYERGDDVGALLGISTQAASAIFLFIGGVAILAAIALAWRTGTRERNSSSRL
ncbi:MAG TPA: hypothetical protein VFU01_12495 [Gemmatimonadaceae bacterium]|nr:hypothetical protein [Gemmatimonadaceae bacterium]